MLALEVNQARKLKRVIETFAIISTSALMVVTPVRLFLVVHDIIYSYPAVLRLTPRWFSHYELTGFDPRLDYFAINLDLAQFRAILDLAFDDDHVLLLSAIPRVWKFIHIEFHRPDGQYTRFHTMAISQAQNPWFDMGEPRFRVGIRVNFLTQVLHFSSDIHQSIILTIKSLQVQLSSVPETVSINKDAGCTIAYFPEGRECCIQLWIHRAIHYFLTVCRIDSVFFRIPDRDVNSNLAPLMLIPWFEGGLLKFHLPFLHVVKRQDE